MQALLIHLSDIHFTEDDDSYSKLAHRILSAILAAYSRCDHCIILVTGDIAYSGKSKEYHVACSFFEKLRSGLKPISSNISVFLCPGNHDCDFTENSSVREILIENLHRNPDNSRDPNIADAICVPQKAYFEFQSQYHPVNNKLLSRSIIEVEGKSIGIDCLNLAWMSQLKESQGKLLYPVELIGTEGSSCDINIALYHHPSNWLEANNARDFEDEIEQKYNFIFTGHEHRDRYMSVVNLTSNEKSTYVNGGVLKEHGSETSSFSTIEIDIVDNSFFYKTWRYCNIESLYLTEDEDCRSINIPGKMSSANDKIVVDEKFLAFLNAVELPFEHPRVNNVTLDKLYVPVYLTASDRLSDEHREQGRVRTSSLHNKVVSEKLVIVLGEPQSGKTATLKILFGDLLRNKLIPIYIQGESIKKSHKREVDNLIKKAIKSQYKSPSCDHITQTHRQEIVVLVDGLDSSPLNSAAKDDVIDYLSQKYEYIVCTMGVSTFASSITRRTDSSLLGLFSTYELDEFNYSARGDLIEAWIRLGQEDSLEPEDLNRLSLGKEKLMNSLAQNNLLPTLPGHVLLVLQYMETGTVNPDMNGAYGHIYQALVTSMLGSVKTFSVDILIAYLSNIAFEMYAKNSTSLEETEMLEAHMSYVKFSDIPIDYLAIVDSLKGVNIIKELSGHISFRHPYLFYYFVACYINKRLPVSEAATHIDDMIETINRDDSCNILIFYSHVGDHVSVVDKVILKIQNQFSEFNICRFDMDVKEISNFYKEVAEMVVSEESHLGWRQERNRQLDEKRPVGRKEDQHVDSADSGLEYRLNSAYRSIDVLGQVLQGNISILAGRKRTESVNEAADLCLRIIASFNDFIKLGFG